VAEPAVGERGHCRLGLELHVAHTLDEDGRGNPVGHGARFSGDLQLHPPHLDGGPYGGPLLKPPLDVLTELTYLLLNLHLQVPRHGGFLASSQNEKITEGEVCPAPVIEDGEPHEAPLG
jgi:hypothetical protein